MSKFSEELKIIIKSREDLRKSCTIFVQGIVDKIEATY